MRALLLALTLAAPAVAAETTEVVGPKPGEAAPDFTLSDHEGKPVKLSDLRGQHVVLEWTNPQCPFVVRHYKKGTMKTLAEKFAGKVTWLAINSSHFATQADNAAWVKEKALGFRILDDHEGKVGQAYGAKTTPDMFVIDPKGNVAFRGAIDDDPYGEKPAPTNHVDTTLTALLAGKPAPVGMNAPYGCTVKYKKK